MAGGGGGGLNHAKLNSKIGLTTLKKRNWAGGKLAGTTKASPTEYVHPAPEIPHASVPIQFLVKIIYLS